MTSFASVVLLAPDQITLYAPPGDHDDHGWALGPSGPPPMWEGAGNLQLSVGLSATDAAEGGGHGPFEPNSVAQGEVFLPFDSGAYDGCVIAARNRVYVLAFTREVPDPVGGPIGCLLANVTEVRQWLPQARLS